MTKKISCDDPLVNSCSDLFHRRKVTVILKTAASPENLRVNKPPMR